MSLRSVYESLPPARGRIFTGIASFDRGTGGLNRGSAYLFVCAEPDAAEFDVAKDRAYDLALSLSYHPCVNLGVPVFVYTRDPEDAARVSLCRDAKLAPHDLSGIRLSRSIDYPVLRDCLDRLAGAPFFAADSGRMSPADIVESIRANASESGGAIFIVEGIGRFADPAGTIRLFRSLAETTRCVILASTGVETGCSEIPYAFRLVSERERLEGVVTPGYEKRDEDLKRTITRDRDWIGSSCFELRRVNDPLSPVISLWLDSDRRQFHSQGERQKITYDKDSDGGRMLARRTRIAVRGIGAPGEACAARYAALCGEERRTPDGPYDVAFFVTTPNASPDALGEIDQPVYDGAAKIAIVVVPSDTASGAPGDRDAFLSRLGDRCDSVLFARDRLADDGVPEAVSFILSFPSGLYTQSRLGEPLYWSWADVFRSRGSSGFVLRYVRPSIASLADDMKGLAAVLPEGCVRVAFFVRSSVEVFTRTPISFDVADLDCIQDSAGSSKRDMHCFFDLGPKELQGFEMWVTGFGFGSPAAALVPLHS